MDIEFVRSRFIKHFDGKTGNIYVAPGRVNLIGEHTDYNGGFVMPGAIDSVVMAEVRLNGTNKVMCYAMNQKDRVEFDVDDPVGPTTTWARYIYGVVREMKLRGVDVKGFNTAFYGGVPFGAGMSSSAALESCFALAINDLFGENKVSTLDMALVGQATEHKYVGVNCGIMDQFASVHGKKNHLIKLDCRSMEYEYLPFNPKGYKVVLIDSMVKHELASSAYNKRRESCENVLQAIKSAYPSKKIELLRDANWDMLKSVQHLVSEEDYKRASFFIGELDRVAGVAEALQNGNYEKVGELMYKTHEALSKEYEVSCEELDFLNDIAKANGVTGSRVMGGGFGGCTINLVKEELYDQFISDAVSKYHEKFGKKPNIYNVVISDGARKIC